MELAWTNYSSPESGRTLDQLSKRIDLIMIRLPKNGELETCHSLDQLDLHMHPGRTLVLAPSRVSQPCPTAFTQSPSERRSPHSFFAITIPAVDGCLSPGSDTRSSRHSSFSFLLRVRIHQSFVASRNTFYKARFADWVCRPPSHARLILLPPASYATMYLRVRCLSSFSHSLCTWI